MSGVYLTKRDPSRNMARFYRMLIAPTLFGEWMLIREWGRLGSGGTVKGTLFPNAGAALLAMQEIVRAKLKRGYEGRAVAADLDAAETAPLPPA